MEGQHARVKFCGITRYEDAEFAVELGGWAIGMIFWPGSPRAVDPAMANRIAMSFRRQTEIAGVFVNPSLDEVTEVADIAHLTLIQLHGDEGPSFCAEVARRTGARVIKAMRVRQLADVQAISAFRTDFHLLDTYVPGVPGGTGETFDWELANRRTTPVPLIVSGGLDANNVGDAIAATRPYAVDVASGVESAPGVKDHEAMRAFAHAAAHADPSAPLSVAETADALSAGSGETAAGGA
ncbi:MAG: phosphoribosylanthranilate isomerase [Baekduia sp.]